MRTSVDVDAGNGSGDGGAAEDEHRRHEDEHRRHEDVGAEREEHEDEVRGAAPAHEHDLEHCTAWNVMRKRRCICYAIAAATRAASTQFIDSATRCNVLESANKYRTFRRCFSPVIR
jgi:hypothetical protein